MVIRTYECTAGHRTVVGHAEDSPPFEGCHVMIDGRRPCGAEMVVIEEDWGGDVECRRPRRGGGH